MSNAKITIWGLENYLNGKDDSLFSGCVFPEDLNRDVIINTIMLRANEFELLYHEPLFAKFAIANWSNKNYWTFSKWAELMNTEYEPLTNYYRETTGTIDRESTRSDVGRTITDGETDTTNTSSSTISNTNNATSTNSKASLNSSQQSSEFTPVERDVTNGSSNGTTSATDTSATTIDTTVDNTLDRNDTMTEDSTRVSKGILGLTTYQKLFEAEVEVGRFNIYNEIANSFVNEFCIMLY